MIVGKRQRATIDAKLHHATTLPIRRDRGVTVIAQHVARNDKRLVRRGILVNPQPPPVDEPVAPMRYLTRLVLVPKTRRPTGLREHVVTEYNVVHCVRQSDAIVV